MEVILFGRGGLVFLNNLDGFYKRMPDFDAGPKFGTRLGCPGWPFAPINHIDGVLDSGIRPWLFDGGQGQKNQTPE